ncbi:hypothetical protein BDV11DRAFT_111167 [Aspergillus similis]
MTPALDISYGNEIHNSPQDSHTTFTYGRPIAFISLSFSSFSLHPSFPSFLQSTVTKGRLSLIYFLSVMFHTGVISLCFPMLSSIREQNDLRILQSHSAQLHCKQLAARSISLIKQAQVKPGMLGNGIPRC